MMGNLPQGAVPGLRPCYICDSNGPLNFKLCEPSGPTPRASGDSTAGSFRRLSGMAARGQATLDDSETGGATKSREPTHVYAGSRQTSGHTP